MKAGYTFSDRYYNMSANDIIRENPDNFSLSYSRIQTIRFKRGTTSYGYDDTTTTSTPPSLTVKAVDGKFSFTFTTGFKTKELIAVLNSTFPGRYKGPKR